MIFRSELQLGFERLAHALRNYPILKPIKSNFADSKSRILLQPPLERDHHLIPVPRSLIPRFPRMHADEVAPDQELADGRVAAGNVTVDVGHPSLFPLPSSLVALNRSFNAILIDSVAMPAVIFE